MSVDYDLVVIGSSAAGIYAAVLANRLQARVALVEQSGSAASSAIDGQILTAMGQTLRQMRQAAQQGGGETALPSNETAWLQATRWSAAARTAIAEAHSPAVLASLGIEVIAGCGEFHRKPILGFMVNGRSLRSRAYLLAIEQLPVSAASVASDTPASLVSAMVSAIDGLATVGWLSAETVLQKVPALEALQRLVIIGNEAIGVELAQQLARLGRSVTLIISTAQILPHEDAEAAFLLQAQLEAEGVQVLTETKVTQVRHIDDKKWVQAGDRAIEADDIILTAPIWLDQATLNLDAANVESAAAGITVNQKLQTTNTRIYACRSVTAGDLTPQLALADAQIAVKNALFLPIAKINDRRIPHIVSTAPPLARIGDTEAAASQRFGKDLVILQQPFKTLLKAQLQGETSGFCKLIVHRNGQLLGAHIVGSQAEELIGTIALAMQQNLTIQAIADLVLPSSALATIIQQTAAEWHRLKLERHPRWQDSLERFFNWRRSIR